MKSLGIYSKKGIFTWTKLIIGLILFSLFVAILGSIYVGFTSSYDISTSEKYDTYNKLQAISNKTTTIGEQYQGGALSDTNTLILAGSTVYSGLQIMLNTISIPLDLIKQANADLPFIPKIFISALLAILTIGFIYSIGSAFARWWM